MKHVLTFLFICLFFCCGCLKNEKWSKKIDDNQITIIKNGDWLEISIFVPVQNFDKFKDFENYFDLLTEAFADYLKITEKGEFECPGIEVVSEKSDELGNTVILKIPQQALKALKK